MNGYRVQYPIVTMEYLLDCLIRNMAARFNIDADEMGRIRKDFA